MNVIDLLIGKKVKVMTDMKIEVELEIESIKHNNNYYNVDLEPATPANDWWPASERRGSEWVDVYFTNGASKKYDNLQQIEVI